MSSTIARSRYPILPILGAVLVLGYLPLLAGHLRALWHDEYYQYFPFVIAAVVALVVSRMKQAQDAGRRGSAKGRRIAEAALIGAAWVLLLGGTVLYSSWLAAVSMNLALGAALMMIGERKRFPNMFGIWCLLWLLVPPPLGLDDRIVVALQRFSATLSSSILDLMDIRHVMSGVMLEMPDKQFFVDEACSGIVSIMTVIAAGAMWVVWRNRPLVHSILLIVSGIGWAIAMNIARIVLIAVAYNHSGTDLSTGFVHEALGVGLFLLTFIALVGTDQLLLFLLGGIHPMTDREQQEMARTNPIVWAWNWATALGPSVDGGSSEANQGGGRTEFQPRVAHQQFAAVTVPSGTAMAVVGAFAFLGVLQVVALFRGGEKLGTGQMIAKAQSVNRDTLPATIGPWKVVDFQETERASGSLLGQFSRTYTLEHEVSQQRLMISLDFPYYGGWHDLCICYRGLGWTIDGRQEMVVADLEQDDEPWRGVSANLARSDGTRAYLLFCGVNDYGQPVAPPSDLITWKPWSALRRRVLRPLASEVYQIQLLMQSPMDIDQETKTDLAKLFTEVSDVLRAALEG